MHQIEIEAILPLEHLNCWHNLGGGYCIEGIILVFRCFLSACTFVDMASYILEADFA